MERNPSFLKGKFNLQSSPEVASAAERTDKRTGKPVEQKANALIQNYLDRFKEILERKDSDKRERGIEAVKKILHDEYIIDSETATDEYIKRQKIIAREQGHGELDVPSHLHDEIEGAVKSILAGESTEEAVEHFPNEQKQLVEEIVALVEEQKTSLDQWVDYLSSPDAPYPDWLKYFAIRNILSLSKYDKDKKTFPKRAENTTNPFPDLNREALSYVLDAINKKAEGKINLEHLEGEDKEQFEKLLSSENFGKLYAFAIEKINPPKVELLTITEGKWVKYRKGTNHRPLVDSLQSHATGWCTAGESVAESQLSRGDFHVYYSLDEQNKPTIPRAAIRMEGDKIAEVRGIAPEQNLDSHIAPIVEEKMKTFPDGKAYEKKAGDMKKLTIIENKVNKGQNLTKPDLIFLYEINGPIQGFGYQRDPRINELRKGRDPKADAPIVFECDPKDITWDKNEITENTKAYVGPLFPAIFEQLQHLEHIYTSFPEGKIRREQISIGGKDAKVYEKELTYAGFRIGDYAKAMMSYKDFTTQKETEDNTLIRLTVKDLGFPRGATTDQIYAKAKDLGLELCPPETGPAYRLSYKDQPLNEWVFVGMKQIPDPGGYPSVFFVERGEGGLWLSSSWARPADRWDPDRQFVFRLPPSKDTDTPKRGLFKKLGF